MILLFWLMTGLYVRRATASSMTSIRRSSRGLSNDSWNAEVCRYRAGDQLDGVGDGGPGCRPSSKAGHQHPRHRDVFHLRDGDAGHYLLGSKRTKTASDYYSAGGGITGTQNGLAIAGDYMSAATLLGLTSMTYFQGFDGYIYCICFYVGWPFIMFIMAERLRNLGKFTFADITSYRLDQRQVRTIAAIGSLTVVIFYLIAQMVGAGQLIKLLFGLDYWIAVVIVGVMMVIYVTFGGMIATTWVQIIKACLLLGGGTLVMLLAFYQFGFNFETLTQKAVENSKKGLALMAPGSFLSDPVTAVSLSLGLMFGTAGLPHILMRFFTVPNAKEARKSVFVATLCVGFFFTVVALMGLSAITIVGTNPQYFEGGDLAASCSAVTTCPQCIWPRRLAAT
jgi:cation/acetate symporter